MNQVRPVADPKFIRELVSATTISRGETFVFSSDHSEYFNLGGDLKFFVECIRKENFAALKRYALNCVRVMHNIARKPEFTIAMVNGRAAGGGFEVLSAFDYIIATVDSKFSLPEIKMNMFPGMGIYSLLSRRVGMQITHELITSGKTYSAEELKCLGVIDKVIEKFSYNEILNIRNADRYAALARKNVMRHDRIQTLWLELQEGVMLWVDCVFKMNETDLSKIDRIVAMQDRLFDCSWEPNEEIIMVGE